MDLEAYLKRINCENVKEPTLENLRILHTNHLKYIPFENIDMHLSIRIEMNLEKIFNKIIKNNRGGFCFELNYLFSWLLNQLGYQINLQSSCVYKQTDNSYGPWFSHLTILVKLENGSYLADVGFSYPYKQPLEFVVDKVQNDMTGYMKIKFDKENSYYTILRCNTAQIEEDLDNESFWTPIYQVDTTPRQINEFLNMLDWVQSDQNPRFYNRSFCIKHIDNGLMMLIGFKLSVLHFENSTLSKRDDTILTKDQVFSCLENEFKIKLNQEFEPKDC